MNDPKQQIVDKLKSATNVLVTVNASPSVDQLAACIGLTLVLNKLDKHATAVFSGEVPSTIEFLRPEDTLEKTTDSLRDFIISLDKTKADKLRYKVEDSVVKIFITPFKTSITEKDLIFSQGDFNVDVVVALGVHSQQELDEAIVAHGRILHDAVVIGLNNTPGADIGTLNWLDVGASSLSEMVASLPNEFAEGLLDAQIATALLTGIVAETKHFSNAKTSPTTMSVSSTLLAAGANQQLVAQELNTMLQSAPADVSSSSSPTKDGSLDIPQTKPRASKTKVAEPKSTEPTEDMAPPSKPAPPKPDGVSAAKAFGPGLDSNHPAPLGDQRKVTQPPTYGDPSKVEADGAIFDPSMDSASQSIKPAPIIRRTNSGKKGASGKPTQTLSDIEDEIVDDARQAVEEALEDTPDPLAKVAAVDKLTADPLPLNAPTIPTGPLPAWMTPAFTPQPPAAQSPKLEPFATPIAVEPAPEPPPLKVIPPEPEQPLTMPMPPVTGITPQVITPDMANTSPEGPPPPPVPPPMMPPSASK